MPDISKTLLGLDGTPPGIGHNGGPPLDPPLENFYEDYCPPRFPQAKSKRAKQVIAKRYRLPVIHVGHAALICPAAGDARLRQLALHQDYPDRQPRRRGRPRAL
jgi:hypothetical protein